MHPAIYVLVLGTLLALASRVRYFTIRRPRAGALMEMGAVGLVIFAVIWGIVLSARL